MSNSQTPTPPESDLSPEDVRIALGFENVQTVYRRAKSGEIGGAYYIGRTLRFHRETFEDWRKERAAAGSG